MHIKTVGEINEYTGTSVNPLSTPDQVFELYSVPSYDSGYPEIIKGSKIGSTKVTVEESDVLICKINPRINRVWIVKHNTNYPLIASSEWIVVRNKSINPDYLKWYFSSPSFRELLTSQVAGIGGSLTRAQPKQVAKYSVPVPNLNEQNKVAANIEKISRIITLRQKQLSALDDLIKARFVEMFGDPEINPKCWKKEQLKEHATVLVGYPFPSEGYTSEGINIVGGYNLMQGYIQWDESKHWPDADGYDQYLLQANDIVMAMDRPWVNGGFKIARVGVSHLPALLIQRTACIRGKDLEQEFLHSLLDTQRFAEHCNITGSLVPHISNKDINSFQVIIPPIEEQKRFTTFVAQIDKSKSAIQKALDETQLLFDCLMQKYFK